MISGHGNDLYAFGGKIKADFSSNVAYNNASAEIMAYLGTQLHRIVNYPDPEARELVRKIALHHGVNVGNVFVTNGSTQAFYLLAHYFSKKKTVIAYPGFAEYEDACRLYGHELSFVPISQLLGCDFSETDTVWWGNPNNPDGTLTSSENVKNVCERYPNTVFIIDAAYAELCPSCENMIALYNDYGNVITVHSLTKAFAVPGLRLGYLIGDEKLIAGISSRGIPWSVNALAQEAGIYIMDNYDDLMPDVNALCDESAALQLQLSRIGQLEILPSACSFFLAKMNAGTAGALKHFLVEKHGILIRDASNFRGLSPRHLRLSVQGKEKNAQLVGVLENYFS